MVLSSGGWGNLLRSGCGHERRPKVLRLSAKTFLSCGLSPVHLFPRCALARFPMHAEYHPNALPRPTGPCPLLPCIVNPTIHYSKSTRRFFFSLSEPSSLLPQGLCICWPPSSGTLPAHIWPAPSHPAELHSHVMSIPNKTNETLLHYSLPCHHVLLS